MFVLHLIKQTADTNQTAYAITLESEYPTPELFGRALKQKLNEAFRELGYPELYLTEPKRPQYGYVSSL